MNFRNIRLSADKIILPFSSPVSMIWKNFYVLPIPHSRSKSFHPSRKRKSSLVTGPNPGFRQNPLAGAAVTNKMNMENAFPYSQPPSKISRTSHHRIFLSSSCKVPATKRHPSPITRTSTDTTTPTMSRLRVPNTEEKSMSLLTSPPLLQRRRKSHPGHAKCLDRLKRRIETFALRKHAEKPATSSSPRCTTFWTPRNGERNFSAFFSCPDQHSGGAPAFSGKNIFARLHRLFHPSPPSQ